MKAGTVRQHDNIDDLAESNCELSTIHTRANHRWGATGEVRNGASERGHNSQLREECEELEAEEGGEVDGAAVAMTRLPQVFVQSKSHTLCVQRCLAKWRLKNQNSIISVLTAGISLNLISSPYNRCLQLPKLWLFFLWILFKCTFPPCSTIVCGLATLPFLYFYFAFSGLCSLFVLHLHVFIDDPLAFFIYISE